MSRVPFGIRHREPRNGEKNAAEALATAGTLCRGQEQKKRCIVLPGSGMSMSSAEGFPLGYGCRYADAAAINKRRKRDVLQNQKGNTKKIGNALFYWCFQKDTTPKRVGGDYTLSAKA